jgi:serine/threonine-protein kinase
VRADTTFELPLIKLEPLQKTEPPPLMAAPAEPQLAPPVEQVKSDRQGSASRASARSPKRASSAHSTERVPSPRTRSAAPANPAPVGNGTLRINTRPWSEVSVDGKPVGNTPQGNLQLPAGKHTITLNNREFGVTKTLVLQIKAGETVTRVLTLLP